MAALTKNPSGTWKATIRRVGWPTIAKTFRTKRDAEDWARRTEDEMVRGVFIQRAPSEKTSVADALDRYEREIVPAKKASTQRREPIQKARQTAGLLFSPFCHPPRQLQRPRPWHSRAVFRLVTRVPGVAFLARFFRHLDRASTDALSRLRLDCIL